MERKQNLPDLVRERRKHAGMSASELARRAGTNKTTITRLEAGRIPMPGTLRAVAGVLGLPAGDLLASANYLDSGDLPSLTPYLRTRYGDLSESAQAEIEQSFREITARYGYDPDRPGPQPGEDEA